MSSAVTKAELQGSPRVEGTQVNMYTSRRNVDAESPASTRTVQFAETVEVSLSQKKTEKSEVWGSLEMWRNSRRRKKAPPGCRSKYWAREDQRDELSGILQVVRDEFSKLHLNNIFNNVRWVVAD